MKRGALFLISLLLVITIFGFVSAKDFQDCLKDEDCPQSYECFSNKCLLVVCQSNNDCKKGEICKLEECIGEGDNKCGKCIPKPIECIVDNDCGEVLEYVDPIQEGQISANLKKIPKEDVKCFEGECIYKERMCTDSDGGINPYEKGEVNIPYFNQSPKEDYCVGDSIIENYCGQSKTKDYILKNFHDRPREYYVMIPCNNGCSNGACLSQSSEPKYDLIKDGGTYVYSTGEHKMYTRTCSDSDGKNICNIGELYSILNSPTFSNSFSAPDIYYIEYVCRNPGYFNKLILEHTGNRQEIDNLINLQEEISESFEYEYNGKEKNVDPQKKYRYAHFNCLLTYWEEYKYIDPKTNPELYKNKYKNHSGFLGGAPTPCKTYNEWEKEAQEYCEKKYCKNEGNWGDTFNFFNCTINSLELSQRCDEKPLIKKCIENQEKNCSEYPCGENKVNICHLPGNQGEVMLCVNKNAVEALLKQGDYCGPCIGENKKDFYEMDLFEIEEIPEIIQKDNIQETTQEEEICETDLDCPENEICEGNYCLNDENKNGFRHYNVVCENNQELNFGSELSCETERTWNKLAYQGCQALNSEPKMAGYKETCVVGEVTPKENSKENITCENSCLLDGNCYEFGYRKSRMFCSEEGVFVLQLPSESSCENNFQCESNLCLDGKCINQRLLKKIIEFFQNIFTSSGNAIKF